jgi:hypothetical protein
MRCRHGFQSYRASVPGTPLGEWTMLMMIDTCPGFLAVLDPRDGHPLPLGTKRSRVKIPAPRRKRAILIWQSADCHEIAAPTNRSRAPSPTGRRFLFFALSSHIAISYMGSGVHLSKPDCILPPLGECLIRHWIGVPIVPASRLIAPGGLTLSSPLAGPHRSRK